MKYAVVGEKINYHGSGKSVNRFPMRHVERTLKDYEIFFVESGVLNIKQGENRAVKRGETTLHLKDMYQGGTAYSENSFYWLHFDGEIEIFDDEKEAKERAEKTGGFYFSDWFAPENSDFAVSLLNEMNRLVFEPDAKKVLDALIYAFLAELARQYSSNKRTYGGNKKIAEIATFIKLNAEKELTTGGVAERFSYNPRYLGKLFKKTVGVSLGKYIEQQKIEKAKRILLATDDGVRAVAESVGYKDEFYFMRVFKKATGTTPTKWRKTFDGSTYT